MVMASWKRQLLIATFGCLFLAILFGGLLSVAVNLSLEQLEEQPDLIIPGANDSPSSVP
ncbi:hypothetical protein C1752_04029 [Acaryochloris thomasi RCC1774]|uniref:Uncharacterized protein n=1 Tax=Acaryochloris thomasi RCC1774 TaxID=1764569 RepID=A0A2W1JEG5_9CYAN|nr:hypothetical protein [Acaryochloris thomasi]PZD72163.1 hypothetical protein C1752_04029 [Acaryochloris thomasi RCC1774]